MGYIDIQRGHARVRAHRRTDYFLSHSGSFAAVFEGPRSFQDLRSVSQPSLSLTRVGSDGVSRKLQLYPR